VKTPISTSSTAVSAPHYQGGGLRGEPATVRLALWSAHHRWLVLLAWLLFCVGLMIASVALGGQRNQSITQNNQSVGESQAGADALAAGSGGGTTLTTQPFYLVIESKSGPLDTSANRAAISALVAILNAATAPINGVATPIFYAEPTSKLPAVLDPYTIPAPQNVAVLSADGSAALIAAVISGDDTVSAAKSATLAPILARIKSTYQGLTFYAFDYNSINNDFGNYINSSLDGLLPPTLLITLLILLLASRSLIAAFVPITLALSAIVGALGLTGLYSRAFAPVTQYVAEVVVLIGLAVAVDYSLFVISRFRAERTKGGKSKFAAIEIASATSGRAVFFSGLAVMISLGGLLLVKDELFKSIAIGSIAVVMISVAGSLTFLPAVLSILDRKLLRLGLPVLSRESVDGEGFWARVVRFATRHSVVAAGGAIALLLVLSAPISGLRLGSTTGDLTTLPRSIEGVAALDVIGTKWPAGLDLKIETIVTGAKSPATAAALAKLAADLRAGKVAGVNGATTDITYSTDGTVADVAAAIPGAPNDVANWNLVATFRTSVVPAYFGSVTSSNTKVYVSGQAAFTMDYSNWYAGQIPLVILFILTLSFLLLLVIFHSLVIPIKAIILNLLSSGAAFGVLVLLFQEGWFKDVSGIHANVIEAWSPAMIFAILFGLSMDYHVFILTRVKEARDRGLASGDAVVKGITLTAGVVTSAAAIMVCVFAAFFTVQLTMIQELGVGLAVAILVDATIVRSLLLPALMKLLGDWNWWLPRGLRWLPTLIIEGEPEVELGAD